MFPEEIADDGYQLATVQLQPGDLLRLYSDGFDVAFAEDQSSEAASQSHTQMFKQYAPANHCVIGQRF